MVGATSDPVDTERARTLWFALLLTLANGFLDAHTYLARGGVFANVHADGRRCHRRVGCARDLAACGIPRSHAVHIHHRGAQLI